MANTGNAQQTMNNFEIGIRKILEKYGLFNLMFYTGIVIERSSSISNELLIQPSFSDGEPIWMPAAENEYPLGSQVLYVAMNGDQHNLLVIAVIKKGWEESSVDYEELKDYPARLIRSNQILATSNCCGNAVGGSCINVPIVEKIIYGEEYGDNNKVWEEEIVRDATGRATSFILRLPPNNTVVITLYLHRENGYLTKLSLSPPMN